jgi:hypothetical protein
LWLDPTMNTAADAKRIKELEQEVRELPGRTRSCGRRRLSQPQRQPTNEVNGGGQERDAVHDCPEWLAGLRSPPLDNQRWLSWFVDGFDSRVTP